MNGVPLPRSWKVALLCCLLLAFVVRLPFVLASCAYGIDDDEFYTLRYALDFFGEPTPVAAAGFPLLFFMTRVNLELLGLSPLALRAFPFACGVFAVVLLALRGRRFVGDRGALFAAGLLALWPWHQYWSGMARYYAPLFLVGIVMIDALESALARPNRGSIASTGVASIVAAAIHPAGLLGLCGVGAMFTDPQQRARHGSKRLAIVGIAVLLGLLLLRFSGLWRTVERVLSGDGGEGANAVQLILNLAFNITPLLCVLAMLGAYYLHREERSRAHVLALSAFLPAVLLGILAALGNKVQGRYAMVGFPALLWLAGRGAAGIVEAARSGLPRFLVASACAVPLVPSVVSNLIDGDRHDLGAATKRLGDLLTGSEDVYAEGHGLVAVMWWGVDRTLPATLGVPPSPRYLGECPPTEDQLAKIAEAGAKTYFLVPEHDLVTPGAETQAFAAWLRAHARVLQRFGVPRFDYHRNSLVLLVTTDRGAT